MEKILEVPYRNVIWRIVGAVRRTAKTIPVFRDSHNGCIRITMVPLSRDANDWLGDLDFGDEDVCEREFVFKIDPKGNTIQYQGDSGIIEPVNCYGYSALKTAWASWKRKFDAEMRSKQPGEVSVDSLLSQRTRYFTEYNGWSLHKGSVCTTVTLDGDDFIRLYVCVSGAKSSEDEECALAGMLEAQKCLEGRLSGAIFNPRIDGDCAPLKQVWNN